MNRAQGPLIAMDDRRFQVLLQRVREGEQDAAWELIDRYGSHVQHVVRRTLSRRMRSKFDSLDFIQAAWASFFRHPDAINGISNPDELIAFLITIARNKVIDEGRRRLRSKKYNVALERSLFDSEVFRTDALVDKRPRPSEVAMVQERWNQWLDSQPEYYQRVVALRLKGVSFKRIARSLDISEKTARRVVDMAFSEKVFSESVE